MYYISLIVRQRIIQDSASASTLRHPLRKNLKSLIHDHDHFMKCLNLIKRDSGSEDSTWLPSQTHRHCESECKYTHEVVQYQCGYQIMVIPWS